MRKASLTVLVLGSSWWFAGVQAQPDGEEAQPELDFLEYLGAWAEDDDEWLAIEEWHKGETDEADDAQQRERRKPDRERKDDDEGE